jgi:hypothetical protein
MVNFSCASSTVIFTFAAILKNNFDVVTLTKAAVSRQVFIEKSFRKEIINLVLPGQSDQMSL